MMQFEPLYLQVKEKLRKDLQAAPDTERLPTLNALQEQYQVSRPTISKALAALAAEGLLVKEAGRGTFALAPAATEPVAASNTGSPPQIIGCIVPLYGAELAQNVFVGIDTVARRRGCRVLMASSGGSVAHERKAAREMIAAGARGLVIYPTLRQGHIHEHDYLPHEDFGVPLVLIDTCTREQGHTQVIFDNKRGGAQMTQWLLGLGRQRIGLVLYAESAHHPGLEARYAGYRSALREQGQAGDSQWVCRIKPDRLDVELEAILDQWLALPEPPDAVIVSDDIMAMDLIERLERRRVSVPGQITVTGFDNRVAARRFQPAFTTTAPDFEMLGETACEALLDGLEAGEMPPQVYILPVPILVREGSSRKGTTEKEEIESGVLRSRSYAVK